MSKDSDNQDGSDVCRDFLNGICKRRNCKFAHPKTEGKEIGMDDDDNICRDFLRNVCKRSNCKFRHPRERKAIARKKAYEFCHDYSNSSCTRSRCSFLHATKEEEDYFNDTGLLPPHLRAQVAVGFGNSDAPIIDGDSPMCRDFLVGKCDRGKRCKFEHRNSYMGAPTRAPRYDRFGSGGSGYDRYSDNSFANDDPYDMGYAQSLKRRASEKFDMPYYRRDDVMLEEENNRLRRTVDGLKKQVNELTAANDILLEQNSRLRVSKVNSLTAVTMTTPSAVVSVTPAVTPIVTPAVAVPPSAQVSNAAAQLSALTASINQQVALNSEVVQQAMQAQLVQEAQVAAMGAPHTSLAAGPASMSSLTMSQPALVSSPYART